MFADRGTACAYQADHSKDRASSSATGSLSVSAGTVITWAGQQWQITEATPTAIVLHGTDADPFPLARSAFNALVQQGTIVLPPAPAPANFTPAGAALLDQAREVDLATAVFRHRIINPDQYADEAQTQLATRAAIPARTKRYWRQLYRDAERAYGSGLIGLLPRFAQCGRNREAAAPPRRLLHEVLETHYDTVTRKPRRGAYGEYLKRAEEQRLAPLSPRTFYREVERHKTTHDQSVAREGTRAAHSVKGWGAYTGQIDDGWNGLTDT